MKKISLVIIAFQLTCTLAMGQFTSQVSTTQSGGNGSAGIGDFGIVVKPTSGQATLGAEGTGDTWSNLILGSNVSGTRRFWSFSKRTSAESHDLQLIHYDGTAFNYPNATFTTSGRVGIGTTTPAARLHIIDGGLRHGGTGEINIDAVGIIGGRFKIMDNGKVGIGTDVPSEKLTVYDAGSATRILIGNPNSASGGFTSLGLGTSANSGGYSWMQAVKSSGSAYGDIILNQSGGNVGIGTATPGDKLSVMGNISVPLLSGIGSVLTDRSPYDGKSIGNYAVGWYGDSENSGAPMAYFSGFGGIKFFAQGVPRMTVASNGNVGIGTTSPGSFKLAVNGKIWTQEVNVAMTNPGPDYVFEKNYDLLSLTELETYISQNKHLPEVPSAKEMEKDGLNLKEMNLILLKKVEELTLHLIEQNKTIATLQNNQVEMLQTNTLLQQRVKSIEKGPNRK
jgi:hypothetical protein